jgi:hypothetical protein
MNSNLYNTFQGNIPIPKEIKSLLTTSFAQVKGADENTEGYNRNQELQKQEQISYGQLKRIKNFFDNFQGLENDPSYILNGGSRMKAWVNNTLTQMRNNVKNNERPTEVDNAKVQSSDYKTNVNTLNRSSVAHKATSQKHDTSMAEQSVVESLRRIKEIISKI